MNKAIIFITGLFLFTLPLVAQDAKLKGRISDAVNNEAIPFANVVISGTQTGTSSDIDGNFTLTGFDPGYVKLQVSFVGYESYTSEEVFVDRKSTPFLEIKLQKTSQELGEISILVDRFKKRMEAPLSMQSIGTKEIESNPGSNRDISRVIQSFPGVGSTPAFRNDVIIRGGGPSENRFYLDDVEIPVLNHFSTQGASGGPVGIINADFIQSVDFYSGSFPAHRSNALSGILDFKEKEGSKEKMNLQFALGASEASFTADGPAGNKTSYIFSLRRSYLQYLFSAIGLPFLPTFNDYQLKVKSKINDKNQLTVISLGSLDRLSLNTQINNPNPSQEYILAQIPVNNQWSYTFGTVYKHFTKNAYHTFVLSRNMLDNQFYKYPDNNEELEKSFDYQSREIENKFRYEYHLRKNGLNAILSANAEQASYSNQTKQKLLLGNVLTDRSYSSNLNLYKYGFSAQISKAFFSQRLNFSAGFRNDGNTYNKSMQNPFSQFSPRISLSWLLMEKLRLNAGVGSYYQLPAYTTLGIRDRNGTLLNQNTARYIRADHYLAGIEYRPSKVLLFSIEGFYKNYSHYPIDSLTGVSLANQGAQYSSVAGAVPAVFIGNGRARGFEILNRVNLNEFSLLASYTYVNSEFTSIDGNFLPSSWDSRHLFTLTANYKGKKNWRYGLKWRYVGGLPYTPYDLEASAVRENWDARGEAWFNYSQLNSKRFSPFHQLDLRIDKFFFFKKWTLMLYLDIQNAYNFQNQGQDYIVRAKNPDGSYQFSDDGNRYILEEIQNTSGTLLPTIGIMIKL